MPNEVYIAAAGLTKVDLTGRIYTSVFDLFAEAYRRALQDSEVREFDAVQIGIMDSEEFENRANIAAKIVDRLGLTGVPAIRTETASSTGTGPRAISSDRSSPPTSSMAMKRSPSASCRP